MPNFRQPSVPSNLSTSLITTAFLIFVLNFVSCEKPSPVIEGLNSGDWKADRNGCLRKRASMISVLNEQKNKLRGLSESQVIELLGRPDRNELYKRNQKFFSYYLQSSPACRTDSLQPVTLVLRFNAMGKAKEVSLE